MSRQPDFNERLAAIARQLVNETDMQRRPQRVVDAAAENLDDGVWASLSLVQEGREVYTPAAATTVLRGLDERLRHSPDQAFGVLSRLTMESNIKLREVARRLGETGEIPAGSSAQVRGDPTATGSNRRV